MCEPHGFGNDLIPMRGGLGAINVGYTELQKKV